MTFEDTLHSVMMLSGLEVVEGTLSSETFASCAGATEEVVLKPEEVNLKPEEVYLKPEEVDLRLDLVIDSVVRGTDGSSPAPPPQPPAVVREVVDLELNKQTGNCLYEGLEVAEGTLSSERFTSRAGAAEEVDLKPEEVNLKPEEMYLKPEEVDLRLDLVIDSVVRGTDGSSPAPPPQPPAVVREVVDLELNKQTGNCLYEGLEVAEGTLSNERFTSRAGAAEEDDLKLEEVDLKPEEVNLKPEEVYLKPEEVDLRLDLVIDSVVRGTDGSSPAPPPQPPAVVREVVDLELNKQTGNCLYEGLEVAEGTLSRERFTSRAGAAEEVYLEPEEVYLKPEEVYLIPEEVDLRLDLVIDSVVRGTDGSSPAPPPQPPTVVREVVDLELNKQSGNCLYEGQEVAEGRLSSEKFASCAGAAEEVDLKLEEVDLRLDLVIDSVVRGTDGSSPAPPPQPPAVVREVVDLELNKQTGNCLYEVVREENGEDRPSSPPASMWRHYRISTTTADGRTSTHWACGQCGKELSKPCWLRDHVKTVHMDELPFQCGVCDKRFRTRKTLYQHTRGHLALYVCEVCGLRFRRASVLQQHQLRHTGESPHACRHCGAAFKQPGNLWKHHRLFHGHPWPSGAGPHLESRQLNYTCLSCQLILPTLPDLIQHKQTCKPSLPDLLRKRRVSSKHLSKSSSGTLHVWRGNAGQSRRSALGYDHRARSRPQVLVTGPPTGAAQPAGPADGALPPRHGADPAPDDSGGLAAPPQARPPAGAALLLSGGGPDPLPAQLHGSSDRGGHLPGAALLLSSGGPAPLPAQLHGSSDRGGHLPGAAVLLSRGGADPLPAQLHGSSDRGGHLPGASLLLSSGGAAPLPAQLHGSSDRGGHLPSPAGQHAAGGTSQLEPARMAAAGVTSPTAAQLQVSAEALLMQHRVGSSLSCPRPVCPEDDGPATFQPLSHDSVLLSGDQLDWSLAEVVFQPTPEEMITLGNTAAAAGPEPPRPQSALACLTPQRATDLVAGVLRDFPAAGCLSPAAEPHPDQPLWPAAVCFSAAADDPPPPGCLSPCLHSLSHSSLPSLFGLSRHSPAAGASPGSSSPVSEAAGADPLPPPVDLLSGEGAVETALEQHSSTSGLSESVSLFFSTPGS